MEQTQDPLLKPASKASVKASLGPASEFRFACTGCGNCCKGPGTVYFTPKDINNIYKFLNLKKESEKKELNHKIVQSRQNGYLVHSAGSACYFLDRQNRCKIYPVRPLQCSTFPFWPSTFESAEALEEVRNDCPGSKSEQSGPSYSALATARRVNKTARAFLKEQEEPDEYFMI